jgi:hypothetical protein
MLEALLEKETFDLHFANNGIEGWSNALDLRDKETEGHIAGH